MIVGDKEVPSNMPVVNRMTADFGCLFSLHGLKERRIPADQQQRNDPENPEAAVDQPPVDRNLSDGARDQRERYDRGTCDDPKGHNPGIPDRITVGADEGYRDDEVGEGEPIGPICDKRIPGVGLSKRFSDGRNPLL